MGSTFSGVWDVLHLFSPPDLVATEREHVHSQDLGLCFLVLPHYCNSDSLESPLDTLVEGGYIMLTGREAHKRRNFNVTYSL